MPDDFQFWMLLLYPLAGFIVHILLHLILLYLNAEVADILCCFDGIRPGESLLVILAFWPLVVFLQLLFTLILVIQNSIRKTPMTPT